jgi:hypothetical protein
MLTFSVPNFSQLFGLSGHIQSVPHRCPPLSRGGPLNSSAGKLLTERLGYARRSVKLTATALKESYTESCRNLMRAIQPVQDLLHKFWATDFVLSWHNHYADVRMALDKVTMPFAAWSLALHMHAIGSVVNDHTDNMLLLPMRAAASFRGSASADAPRVMLQITRKKYAMKTVSKENTAHADVLYEEVPA